MNRRIALAGSLLLGCAGAVALASPHKAASPPKPIVREERTVVVDGRTETWRLEWTRKPVPECSPTAIEWNTCPCEGFAFGERGPLDLVRLRDGKEIERLPLGGLFDENSFGPGAQVRRVEPTPADEAALRSADQAEARGEGPRTEQVARQIMRRAPAAVMVLGDYDHDGQATEFLLQLASVACGWRMQVAVGVSRREPHLHVFHTAAHPHDDLTMRPDHWQALLTASGPLRRVDWRCGDHFSETETEIDISTGPKGISVHEREYECTDQGTRGKLLSASDW